MRIKNLKSVSVLNVVAIIAAVLSPIIAIKNASAANLSITMVRFDRMAASTATGGTVCVKPTTVASTEGKVVVTFPSDFVLNTTAANWTTDVTPNSTWPTGAVAWTGLASPATAVDNTGKTATFTSGDLASGATTYCFNFTGTTTLTTGAAGANKIGSVATQTAASAAIDNASYATAVISNDQVTVNATVPPNFSFSLDSNALTFPALSTTVASTTTPVTGLISTNANNGWIAWVKSATGTLTSASTGAAIPAVTTANDNATTLLSGANYGYGLNVAFVDSATATTGTVSQGANYGQEYANAVSSGGTLETVFRPIASANGVTDGDTVVLTPRARVTTIQQAATDYTDTLTVIAAGRF
jgi:hypothetical protein